MILGLLTFFLLFVIYSTPTLIIFIVLRRKKEKDSILRYLNIFICTSLIVQIIGFIESLFPLVLPQLYHFSNEILFKLMAFVDYIKTSAILFTLGLFVHQIWLIYKKEDYVND